MLNLDRVAEARRQLRCSHTAPVCSPSRSAFTTGGYPTRGLTFGGMLFTAGANDLNPAERTLAVLRLRDGAHRRVWIRVGEMSFPSWSASMFTAIAGRWR